MGVRKNQQMITKSRLYSHPSKAPQIATEKYVNNLLMDIGRYNRAKKVGFKSIGDLVTHSWGVFTLQIPKYGTQAHNASSDNMARLFTYTRVSEPSPP